MRLLHVTHQYHPAIGGSERYITDLSETLSARGHQVDVFTTQSREYQTWRNELPRFEVINGVNVYRFPTFFRSKLAWWLMERGFAGYVRRRSPWYSSLIFWGSGPVSPQFFFALLRRAGDYDLVHINQLHYSHAFTAFTALKGQQRPIVLTPHVHAEQWQTYDIDYLGQVLRGSDAILADTLSEQEFLQQRLPNRTVVRGGHGLNLAGFPSRDAADSRVRFGLPDDAFVLLFLGRKTEYKGLAPLLRAFTILRRQRPELYLLALGPETAHSEQLLASYAGAEGLIVRGAVSDEERLAALAACDALVMPSTGEAFGIVYLEAWAYGKPVIGANIQAVASLIEDGVDGLLVEPDAPGQLVAAIRSLIDQPERARQMGKRGAQKLHGHYTTERIADVVEGLYARLLRRVRSGCKG